MAAGEKKAQAKRPQRSQRWPDIRAREPWIDVETPWLRPRRTPFLSNLPRRPWLTRRR